MMGLRADNSGKSKLAMVAGIAVMIIGIIIAALTIMAMAGLVDGNEIWDVLSSGFLGIGIGIIVFGVGLLIVIFTME